MPETILRSKATSIQTDNWIDRADSPGYFQLQIRPQPIVVRLTGTEKNVYGSFHNFRASPASWAAEVFLRLQQMRSYPKNWDSYGGRALTTAGYLAANELLGRLMFESTPKPSVVPTGRGGVQFEWHRKGSHIEVYFSPDGNAEVSFEDDFGAEWEGPLTEVAHRLFAVLENL
jgi:hypothetical protein